MSEAQKKILDVLNDENIAPSDAVIAMCEKIKHRHPDRVLGFLYYGSSLRAMNDTSKMLDFYVLVDSYSKTHRNPLRAFLNWLIPPAVYYLENQNEDKSISTCKYSIISLDAFERKTTGKALLSVVWGRFSQPCVLLFARDNEVENRIQLARVNAIKHMFYETAPLTNSPVDAVEFWARGFRESYRTELRPESSEGRSQEIVRRYQDRYTAILNALSQDKKDGKFHLPEQVQKGKIAAQFRWFLRRVVGKPAAAIRVLNSAFTFDSGLDYLLHKLKSHSGVTIDITESQRRHPLLWSPVLGWKLWRKGAFK